MITMNVSYTAEELAFRDEVRAFLESDLPADIAAKTRLGKFQVLQHRVVDMQTELEQATSMVILAVTVANAEDSDERSRTLAAAKFICTRAARKIARKSSSCTAASV